MPTIVITPPAVEPIAVADARAHCRSSAGEDAMLTAIYIPAARAAAETMMAGTAIIQRTLEERYPAFDSAGLVFDAGPVVSITSVSYVNTAGATVTLDEGAYQLTHADGRAVLLPAYDTDWPDARDVADAVRVRYVAGLAADQASVPADLRAWLLMTVGTLYMQRESVATGTVAELPGRFVDGLLDKYRTYGF